MYEKSTSAPKMGAKYLYSSCSVKGDKCNLIKYVSGLMLSTHTILLIAIWSAVAKSDSEIKLNGISIKMNLSL